MRHTAAARVVILVGLITTRVVAQSPWDQSKLLPEDETYRYDERFGFSVDVSGDYVVVGAPEEDAGAAYVFDISGNETKQVSRLVASDADYYDNFGHAVAIDGDLIVVGAPDDDDDGTSSGSCYVFTLATTVFDGEVVVAGIAKLTDYNGASYDKFGAAVAVDGDIVVVGAPGKSDGYAIVYRREGLQTFDQVDYLYASDSSSNEFGFSVAASGSLFIVGANGDSGGGYFAVAAYAFVEGDDGMFEETAKLSTAWTTSGDYFGHAVDVDGDIVVVGGPYDSSGNGAAAVFVTTDGGRTFEHTATLANETGIDNFAGFSVGVSGSTVVISSYLADAGNVSAAGLVLVYSTSDGGYSFDDPVVLIADDAYHYDEFGWDVAIDGNVVIVGAPDDDDHYMSSGSAYAFVQPSPTAAPTYLPSATPTTTAEPTTAEPTPTPTLTHLPTSMPTPPPTPFPSSLPTVVPTYVPSMTPTPIPTAVPTDISQLVSTLLDQVDTLQNAVTTLEGRVDAIEDQLGA